MKLNNNKWLIAISAVRLIMGVVIGLNLPNIDTNKKVEQVQQILEASNMETTKTSLNARISGNVKDINDIKVKDADASEYIDIISEDFKNDGFEIKDIQAYDISFLDKFGKIIKPEDAVTVYINMDMIPIIGQIKDNITWEIIKVDADGNMENIQAVVYNGELSGHVMYFDLDESSQIIIATYTGGEHDEE